MAILGRTNGRAFRSGELGRELDSAQQRPRTHWLRVIGYALFLGGGMGLILLPGTPAAAVCLVGLTILAVGGGE